MKNITIRRSFVPAECSPAESYHAATLGAGVQGGEVIQYLAKYNLTTVVGSNLVRKERTTVSGLVAILIISQDVGVAGWAIGGGHGILTGVYGMGADNIIEASLVTPQGDIVTANQCQNSDLFWAVRGGGGEFGIITSLTVKVYPMPSLSIATVSASARNGTSSNTFWKIIASVHKDLVKLQDVGVMGYYTASGPPYSFQYTMFQPNITTSSIDRLIMPLKMHLDAYNRSIESSSFTSWIPSWYFIEELYPTGGDAGTTRAARATRLLPKKAVEDTDMLAKTFEVLGTRSEEYVVNNLYVCCPRRRYVLT
jgi:hypothetical protein